MIAEVDLNEVILRGRLSAPADARTLPTDDVQVTFRLVVRRGASTGGQSVDVITCTTTDASLGRRASAWQPGDRVEVRGSLHRRFWRTGSGTASVVEVACTRGRKVRPA